ncbi:hypothetical protein, conserved [Leishmania tarentolae]|uniref:Amastin-like protein n=1 Tax=Leishmania tarentolae TaxID=5689 RepID=A0A640KKD2_LEITA|nr:hypothetical protein, conserved [Leishmania tarentolae]
MKQELRSGGDASWDSHPQQDHMHSIFNMESNSWDGVAMKGNAPANMSGAGSSAGVYESSYLNELEYSPTAFSPRRFSRCRIENVAILATLILAVIFCIVSITTPLFYYRSPNLTIWIDSRRVWGTWVHGFRQHYSIHTIFCHRYAVRSDAYLALYSLLFLVFFIGLCLSLFPIICGCVLFCTYLIHSLLLASWFLVMAAMILGVQMYSANLCKDMSLKKIGFRYGPAFGFTAALFSLLSLTIIILALRAIWNPLRLLK